MERASQPVSISNYFWRVVKIVLPLIGKVEMTSKFDYKLSENILNLHKATDN